MPDEMGLESSAVTTPENAVGNSLEWGIRQNRPLEVPKFARQDAKVYGRTFKRSFDIVGASLLLILFAPLLLFAAMAILLEDGRPLVFVQSRIGRGGGAFPLLKFRTMVRGAESELERWQQQDSSLWNCYVSNNFKISDDPRILRCGRFLRRFSLDELLQFWNVLKGEMSLVGPRPLLAGEIAHYANDLKFYASVRPGITGLWQVSGRSRTTFGDRVRLDRIYIQNMSFFGDCKLLLLTVPSVIMGIGAQ